MLSLQETEAIQSLISCKLTVADHPLGAINGGVQIDPRNLSKTELERVTRSYTAELIKKGLIQPANGYEMPNL